MKLIVLPVRNVFNKNKTSNLVARLLAIIALTWMALSAVYAQTSGNITLDLEQVDIAVAFKRIEDQSGYIFLYAPGLTADMKIALKGTKTVERFLKDMESQVAIEFEITGKNISARPKKKAKERAISGTVIDDATGEPMPGVSVIVKGSGIGTVTGSNGEFELTASNGEPLVFSFIGYTRQEIVTEVNTILQVRLVGDISLLQEVVVTALGIEREEAKLGYAVQTLNGDDINKAREVNLANALSGKIAGVSVVANPSGVGGSARVIIRGERSLNISKNQPLYVVDGVPMINELVGSSGRNNNEVDYGNTAGMINPDDIESISVLKGPSASALYGSRGQNGVIIIKTKSGKGQKGVGISVSSTVTFEDPLVLPEFQNVYGQGVGGVFNGYTDTGTSVSWGPKMEGQPVSQFDSPTTNGFRGADVGNLNTVIGPVDIPGQLAARGDILPTPFVAYPDNMKDFFETGITFTQNVAIASGGEKGNIRGSYTYMDQKGMIPNTDLKRNTFAFLTDYHITPKLSFHTNTNYVKSMSDNRPNVTYGQENLMYFFIWEPRSVNTLNMRDYWQPGRTGMNQFSYNYTHDNPYLTVYENTNGQELDRVFGNVSAKYQFADWLSLMARVGTDYTNEFRDRRRSYSLQNRFPLGAYREEKIMLQETNADFLLSLNKDISTSLMASLNVGGSIMYRKQNQSDISAPQLVVPGIYILGNSKLPLDYSTFRSEKQVNSLYATSQIAFRDFVYLDLSARNDWSSTLPPGNRSYFYPSATASVIISDMLNLKNSTVSFAKLRMGYAEVGNDTDPYQLTTVFAAQTPVQGQTSYAEPTTIPNTDLKPERTRSFEIGTDVKFFGGRVGIDLAAYRTRTSNQIMSIRMSSSTGYPRKVINAGLVENKGIEAMLNLVPVRTAGGLSWTIDVNFSKNRGEVLKLYVDPVSGQEVTSHALAGRYVSIEARVGERMGDMYGKGYVRVSDKPGDPYYDPTGQHVGKIVYNTAGAPLANGPLKKLGNYNPDWMTGVYNTVSFKGLSLGFLLDIRKGGELYSHTNTIGHEAGTLIETLKGRDNGYDLTQEGNGVVGDGVIPVRDGAGNITGYTANTVKLDAQAWHIALTGNRQIHEAMTFDASFIKLREVKLSYVLPKALLEKTPFVEATISAVGRNLAVWSDVPHIDPETSSTVGGTLLPGVDSMSLPTTRSYGFNVSLKF